MELFSKMTDKISFLFIEGFRNLWRHKLTAFTSIFSVFLALLLVGILFIIGQNSHYPIEYFRSKYKIEVFFENNISNPAESEIIKNIRNFPEVRSVTPISKKDAVRIFKNQFGEDVIEMLGYNPLPSSAVVNIIKEGFKKINIAPLIEKINSINGVDSVHYQGRLINRIEKIYQLFLQGLKIAIVLIIIFSIIIISNTIKLTIYSRKDLIKTLDLIGATKFFIKVPFILEGILQSFIGAVLAVSLIFGLMKLGNNYLTQVSSIEIIWNFYFGIILFTLSIVIGFIGSYRAVSKFL